MQDRDHEEGEFADVAGEGHSAAPQPSLELDEDDRLPWLESADDEEEGSDAETGRLIRFALFGLALLALIGGGLWLANRHKANDAAVAEGGVIKAPAEPYKTVPKDQRGKTYAGTGDEAYGVAEGKSTTARLGDGTAPAPAAAGDAAPEGVGVQVGAYKSQADAEAGWQRLSGGSEALKAVKHRVVEGSADIGTVYRLQALAADDAAANALCSTLKAGGIPCQVKH